MSELQTTRERLLASGSHLLSRDGLNGLTIGSLAEQTSLSKSGLFAHFKSKEKLQIELLGQTGRLANQIVVAPAMQVQDGLPRLQELVRRWMGWTRQAGLGGGCAIAAGMFEMDDQSGPVRDTLLAMEEFWRGLLTQMVARAVELKQLRSDLDVEQFVWELCGMYLSHHVSLRFIRDREADHRAQMAVQGLIERSLPYGERKISKTKVQG